MTESKTHRWSSLSKYTFGEIFDTITAFYQEPANLRIPVVIALDYAQMKLTGSTTQQLQDFETNWRQIVAKAN